MKVIRITGWLLAFTALVSGAEPVWSSAGLINDAAVTRRLEREGKRLLDAGETLTNWAGMLGDRTASLALRAAGRRRLTPAQVYERSVAGCLVVGVYYLCESCGKRHLAPASGFAITRHHAVTDRHVLAGWEKNGLGLTLMTRDGVVRPVRAVVAAEEATDLVVLEAGGEDLPPLPLAKPPPVGSPVAVISHPDSKFFMFTTGVVARHAVWQREGFSIPALVITAEYARGSSGGPVLDDRGNVVAVVNSTESVYHDARDQEDLQMVFRVCVPATVVQRLVGGGR